MGSYDFREDEINYLLVIIMIIQKNGNNMKQLIEEGKIPKSIDFKDIKKNEGIYYKNEKFE